MTREEARSYIIRHCNPGYPQGKTEWECAINMAIEALSGESSDDTISRQAAIDAFEDTTYTKNEIRRRITELPSAQPERKTGRWIPCSERLPLAEYGESNNVLATCGHRDGEDTSIRWIKTLYFNGGNWCYPTGETYEQKVYAWMPLPEAFREGEG